MIYSLFKVIIPSVQYFGSAASNSRSRASKTSRLKLKREVPRTEKRFKIALMFSGRRRRSRKDWIYESRCQVRDRIHVFARFFFPLNTSATTVYARSTFCIQPAFYSQSAVCILPLVFSLQSAVRSPQSPVRSPQSAVRSPQSAVRSPQSAVRSLQSAVRSPQPTCYTDRI